MRLGMLDDIVLHFTMIPPRCRLALVDATCSPEHLIAQTAHTGEDVETSSMLLENACYRERADGRFFCAPSKNSARSGHLRPRIVR